MKIGKKIAWVLLILLAGIQFIRPDKNEDSGDHLKAFLAETNPPQPVMELLNTACMDCHSNNTKYPWYNQIAPVSYWIADHIKEGKGHLNFSEWDKYEVKRKDHKLEEVIETVEDGFMPLNEYTWTHEGARLTQDDKAAIVEWAKKTRLLYALNGRPD
jgi:hypothetical protein